MFVRSTLALTLCASLIACDAGTSPAAGSTAELKLAPPTHDGAVPGCGPEVTADDGAIRVRPTGVEDTANLQCALDAAVASGRPTAVRLAPGTFQLAQIVAKGFVGSLEGSGAGATTLTNVARPVLVTPVDMWLEDPGPSNPWPSLFAFVGGSFRVSDLTVRITGEAPTTGWSIFGIDPPVRAFGHAFVVLGERANAEFARVELEGAPAPSDLAGLNLLNGIFFEGFLGTSDQAPISGRFLVHDCVVRQVASPVPVSNARHADVAITGNLFEGTLLGGEIADLEDVRYAFAGNRVDAAWAGVTAYDGCTGGSSVCGMRDATLLVAGNTLRGFDGVEILSTFGPEMRCAVTGNTISYDAGSAAVVLGAGTTGCLVVTAGAVADDGTGNHVIVHP